MTLRAVTCDSCGGAVAMEVGADAPRCLFCGSPALTEQAELPDEIEPPSITVPFSISDDDADAAFRKFARSSFWYPKDIRDARLELSRLYLPAWVFAGTIETHYAALVKAMTRSGSQPVSGSERTHIDGVLVPSSSALTRSELHAISPFEMTDAAPFSSDTLKSPYELGSLTRAAATEEGLDLMRSMHRTALSSQISSRKMNVSSLHEHFEGEPVLLPIFIGAYRRRDEVYRIVINGQTGKLTGAAPFSWAKLALVIFIVLGTIGVFMLCSAILAAIGSQL